VRPSAVRNRARGLAGSALAAVLALPAIIVCLFAVSLFDQAERWLLLLTLAVWLALVWYSPVGLTEARSRLGARIFVAVTFSVILGVAALLGVLLSKDLPGADIASYVVRSALILWALGLMGYAVRQAVTRPWRLRSTILVLLLPMLAAWGTAIWLVARHRHAWQLWVVAYFGPLVLFGVLSFLLPTHRLESLFRRLSPWHDTPSTSLKPRTETEQEEQDERRRGIGLAAAGLLVASSGLLLLAAVRVPFARTPVEQSEIGRGGIASAPAATTLDGLAQLYEPVLRLDPKEQWPESDVASVLTGTPLPSCSHKPCPLEIDAAKLAQIKHQSPPSSSLRVLSDGTVYPLVRNVDPKERAAMRDKHRPLAAETYSVLEYWLFYPYDDWTAPSALGIIDQAHPSDWEFVAVGLGRENQPLFVAYSEHCGGVWRPWRKALVVAVEKRRRSRVEPNGFLGVSVANGLVASHPLVTVARGSHANYPTSRELQPDWLGCATSAKVLRKGVGLLTFMINAHESLSSYGPIQVPRIETLKVARRVTDPDWLWGPAHSSTMSIGWLALPKGDAPRSPGHQPAADDPLTRIFLNPHWGCDLSSKDCRG
jgi:hypothetical protein